jgi:hypothetical protein
MTVEQLLKPRYKVIADYPGSQWKVNQVIEKTKYMNGRWYVKGSLHDPDDYPAIFSRLEWWQERKLEDMPEYVRYAENGMVAKVDHFDLETTSAWFMYLEGGIHPYCPGGSALENTHWLPATLADYTHYCETVKEKV